MQTSDTWPAWKRAMRWGWIRFRTEGILRPSMAVTALGIFFVLCGAGALWAETVFRATLDDAHPVTITLLPAVTSTQVQEFYAALQQVKGAGNISFVPHDVLLTEVRSEDPVAKAFLDGSRIQNPFTDSFRGTLTSRASFDALRTFLSQDKWRGTIDVRSFLDVTDQQRVQALRYATVDYIAQLTMILLSVSGVFLLCLLLALAATRLEQSATERTTVRLLGASWATVNGPIVAELAYMLFGALIIACVCAAGLGMVAWEMPSGVDGAFTRTASLMMGQAQQLWSIAAIVLVLCPPVLSLLVVWLSSLRRHA